MESNLLRWRTLTLAGWLLAVLAIGLIQVNDRALWAGQPVRVRAPDGEQLSATYYPGNRPGGVLLLEGFGSDQVSLRSAASEFAREGLHVFTFDFSGHGRSGGTLAFDNARTDRLARQALEALRVFQQLSGLDRRQILVMGHSLGARVALQAATLEPQSSGGLILIGAQVNLSTNVQAEFFTGASDAELDWVQALGPQNPAVPIFLISGTWDDILTPEGAQLLLCKLAGSAARCQPFRRRFGDSYASREALLVPALLHNYEIISARVLSAAKEWAGYVLGVPITPQAPSAGIRIAAWLAGLAGITLGCIGLARWLPAAALAKHPNATAPHAHLAITNMRRFLTGKLLLWLAALPFAALLSGFYFFLPIGVPVLNLIYVGLIGGYGLLMLLLYRLGRVPGVQGRLSASLAFEARNDPRPSWKTTGCALAASLLIFIATAAFARTGWFYVFPFNLRLAWLALFALPTALGFWIGLKEMQMARSASGRASDGMMLALIGLAPFFVWNAFLVAIGSLSGLVGGLQGLVVLAWALIYGQVLRATGQRAWLAALLQSLLLYGLLLPQGVLFK